jgi:hypothetical protein
MQYFFWPVGMTEQREREPRISGSAGEGEILWEFLMPSVHSL